MPKRKTTEEKLREEMLKYYRKQNKILDQKQREAQKAVLTDFVFLEETEKRAKETKKMANKLKRMKDNTIIKGLSSAIIEDWNATGTRSRVPSVGMNNVFRELIVQEWFLNKGIDLQQLGILTNFTHSFDSPEMRMSRGRDFTFDYFNEFGMSEKIRWQKIRIEIEKILDKWLSDKALEDAEKEVDILVQRARKDDLYSVSTVHIKQFSAELGIDTSRKLSVLTNAVSTKLTQEFGGSDPKRKRTLTKSIKIEVFKRDGHTCVECGAGREAKLHVHHKMPVSRGGTDEMSNLVTLCESCNFSIGNRIYPVGDDEKDPKKRRK